MSRKDQTNKKKLSPLTNHKNTKNGIIKGGFNRKHLFQRAEQGFDKLFSYNRQQSESFDFHNIMKNGPTSEQLKVQEQEILFCERKKGINQENLLSINLENKKTNYHRFNTNSNIVIQKECHISINIISNATLESSFPSKDEKQTKKKKKKRRRP